MPTIAWLAECVTIILDDKIQTPCKMLHNVSQFLKSPREAQDQIGRLIHSHCHSIPELSLRFRVDKKP